jgi:outer membrane lipoprotein SlyB
MKVRNRALSISIILIFLSMITVGCMTTEAQKGTAVGAAGGSLAGLAIGSLTGSAGAGAAIGAVSGAALGYVVGNEKDKEQAKKDAERERAALEKSRITNDSKTAYHEDNSNSLVGTSWRIVSIKSPRPIPEYSDMVVTFQTNTKVTTLTVLKDGKTTTETNPYRVVGDVLILTDSVKNTMVNTKYNVQGRRMTIVGEGWNIVMDKT